ncbi:MAG: hypothetical protein GC149_18740 [Gammaproteobacteria bacterium]|nr:hypothetical protein [Gammaproteobacteria bacterium]
MKPLFICVIAFAGILSAPVCAKDKLKLDTTIIKGNKEMPQIVYIVPWKEMKEKKSQDQTLVLHSLFGDLYDPVSANSDKLK